MVAYVEDGAARGSTCCEQRCYICFQVWRASMVAPMFCVGTEEAFLDIDKEKTCLSLDGRWVVLHDDEVGDYFSCYAAIDITSQS
jgi:hypothetical protein